MEVVTFSLFASITESSSVLKCFFIISLKRLDTINLIGITIYQTKPQRLLTLARPHSAGCVRAYLRHFGGLVDLEDLLEQLKDVFVLLFH